MDMFILSFDVYWKF